MQRNKGKKPQCVRLVEVDEDLSEDEHPVGMVIHHTQAVKKNYSNKKNIVY